MQPTNLIFTQHALERMRRRNISEADVQLACVYGATTIRAGAVCYFLGRRQVSALGREWALVSAHLEGVTVLCCSRCQQTVLTVYHNLQGLKKHRHKHKYDRRPWAHRLQHCSYCLVH